MRRCRHERVFAAYGGWRVEDEEHVGGSNIEARLNACLLGYAVGTAAKN